MKTAMVCVMALLSLGAIAKADEAIMPTVDNKSAKTDAFALDFSADAEYYGFADKLFVINPTVGFKLFEVLDASVALPVYNNTTETGIGDLKLAANYGLFQSKTGLFGADSSTLSIGAEVGVPLDGAFASDSTNLTGNLAFGMNWGKIALNQTGSYLFDSTGNVYVPVFGGFVDETVFSADSSLSYAVSDSFKVGVDFSQNYTGNTKYLSLGPAVNWEISHNAVLDLSVGFPVEQQDMLYGDCDYKVSAGLAFKF